MGCGGCSRLGVLGGAVWCHCGDRHTQRVGGRGFHPVSCVGALSLESVNKPRSVDMAVLSLLSPHTTHATYW